jgi:hypothetical protein
MKIKLPFDNPPFHHATDKCAIVEHHGHLVY